MSESVCKAHPKYKAKRKPTANCEACRVAYADRPLKAGEFLEALAALRKAYYALETLKQASLSARHEAIRLVDSARKLYGVEGNLPLLVEHKGKVYSIFEDYTSQGLSGERPIYSAFEMKVLR